MPSIMLRDIPADVVARVRVFARSRGLSLVDGAVELLEAGLERRASQSAGGRAAAEQATPEVRQERARTAALARWEKSPR